LTLTLSSNSASTSLQLTKHAADHRINLWTPHGHLKLAAAVVARPAPQGAVIDLQFASS
jgi:hypothetical protein